MTESLYKVKVRDKRASVIEVWTEQDFELWIDDKQVEKKPNPYGFIPFIIYPNLREPKKFWGISDLAHIMEPQRELNRVQVEGYDPTGDELIVVDSFSWSQVDKLYDRLSQQSDQNIDTVAKAGQRGEALLRKAEIESEKSTVRIPVNCGQQLYDVIDITDGRAGLSAEKKRVLGLILVYNSFRNQYEQHLSLGAT
ncbi:hypothetical protein ACFLWR_06645 [Chloroflexota bacterium]